VAEPFPLEPQRTLLMKFGRVDPAERLLAAEPESAPYYTF
jgi:hypothetical protein